jgi:CDP-diacylglycerol--glycerol-3-phosphate 3-phosphatidyltransferase
MYRHVPNLLTIARLVLAVAFFWILNDNDAESFTRQMWIAFGVFLIAVFTDILDGYLARAWKVESSFGRVVDPFVDKLLICGAFIFFSSNQFISGPARGIFSHVTGEAAIAGMPAARTLTGVMPWMVVVLIAREFLITSIRGLAEAQGIDFRADWAGKIKMVTQSVAVGAVLVDLALTSRVGWMHVLRDVFIYTTVVVTILSSLTYIHRAWKLFGGGEKTSAQRKAAVS